MRTGLALAIGAAAGAVAGAVGTYLLTATGSTRVAPPAPSARTATQRPTPRSTARPPAAEELSSTSERAELYGAAARADATELERLVAAASAAGRDRELAVLLARYAELDPVRAVELARAMRLSADAAAPLYAVWAARDADAALAALGSISLPTEAGTVAAAMLPVLPAADAFERVAAALGVRASAFSPAMSPTVDSGTLALERLSQDFARRDLSGARALLPEIRDPRLRTTLETAVLLEWARTDPDGVLDHIATLDPAETRRTIVITMRELLRADPLHALDVARQLPGDSRQMLEQSALQRLAETDARAALRYVERMPAGPKRGQSLPGIAYLYGQQQPDEALAWARASTAERGLLEAVISGIALTDPDKAFALAAAAPPAQRLEALQGAVGYRSDRDAAAMADRIAALAEPDLRESALTMLVSGWGVQKPQEALDWLQRNGQSLPADVYHDIGRQLARNDPAAAASYLTQIPSAARPGWIAAVAQGMAQNDLRQGLGWLDQFRGQPGYAEGVAALGPALAQEDPGAAAALLATVGGPMRETPQTTRTVQMIADFWGRQDPTAAAQWVTTLETAAARTAAIPTLTAAWSNTDLPAATQWALRLPAGAERDGALNMLLAMGTGTESPPDLAVGRAFSTNAALERAVSSAARQLAGRNPDRARALASAYLADPAARARVEKLIGEIQKGDPGVYEITFGVSQ